MDKNPPEVNVDCARIQQVLFNLIGNSIKYTYQGSVILVTRNLENRIEVNISDTGVGIPEGELDIVQEN